MPNDYYAILGVSRAADPATIHSAFRALARRYHPDAGGGSSTTKFREVLDAYHTLSDPTRRRQHDIDLGHAVRSAGVVPEPLFEPARSATTPVHYTRAPAAFDDFFVEFRRFLDREFQVARLFDPMF